MFVNTLNADGKCPVQYCENLQLPIQTQLSEKQKTFSEFFFPFLESTSNFKHLRTKMMVIANMFRKLETGKNFVTTPCKKCCFGTRLDSEHVKVFQIVAESTWERFFHVFHHSKRSWFIKYLPCSLLREFETPYSNAMM